VLCLPLENLAQETPDLLSVLRDLVYHVTPDRREDSNYMLELLTFVNSSTTVSLSNLQDILAKIDPIPSEHSPKSTQDQPDTKPQTVQTPVDDPSKTPVNGELPVVDESVPEDNQEEISLYQLLSAFNMDRFNQYKEQQKKKKNQKKDKKSDSKKVPNTELDYDFDFVIPGQVEAPRAENYSMNQHQVVQEEKVAPPIEHIDYGETEILTKNPVHTSQPYLIHKRTNERIFIHDTPFMIGKKRSAVNYCIEDNATVSRVHAQITCKNGEFFVTDLDSTNYTFVNGRQIDAKEPTVLAHGTVIGFSDEEFEFNIL